jgi:2-methylisocitrate lyase-like PEP mutase family enzyme
MATADQQAAKAEAFRALHFADAPLVLPNIWDPGSAVMAADAGFPALATTSAGVAWTLGYGDGEQMPRGQMLDAVARIAERVALPLTADMEAGYGASPVAAAGTVAKTLEAGAIGVNLEDGLDHGAGTVLEMADALARIVAARAVADDAGIPLVINARTDVYFGSNRTDGDKFSEAVTRANSYLQAGADCAFVIAVNAPEVIERLVREIDGPLNIIAGSPALDVNVLAGLGVKRISLAGGMTRSVLGHFRDALLELRERGTTSFLDGGISHPELNQLYGKSD